MTEILYPIRAGDFSVERDRDPHDDGASPIVRVVLDRCELDVEKAVAFYLRGDERGLAVQQLRLLGELEPGEADLGALGQFAAVARRITADAGSVTLERFDDVALVEKLEIPLAHAARIAVAIAWLIDLGDRDPATIRQLTIVPNLARAP